MDNYIIMKDENNHDVKAKVINIFEIDGMEYLVYSIEEDEDRFSVNVKKVIKDVMGEDDLIDITNEDERQKVFEVIDEYIERLS